MTKFPIDISIGIGSAGAVTVTNQTSQPSTNLARVIDQQTANWRAGFYFRASGTGEIGTVSYLMWREGGLSTGTYDLELRNYTSGGTVGSLISSVSIDPAGLSTVNTSPTTINAVFTGGNVVSGNDYCLIFNESGLSGNGVYEVRGDTVTNNDANLGMLTSTNSGSSWTELDNNEPYLVITTI